MEACAKLRRNVSDHEVSIVCLLDVWPRGIAHFDVAASLALEGGLLAKLLYMLTLC